MSFQLFGFILGRTLAQNRGITDTNTLNRAGLVLGMTGFNAVGLVVATQMIDDAVPATIVSTPQASGPITVPSGGKGDSTGTAAAPAGGVAEMPPAPPARAVKHSSTTQTP